MPRTKQWAEQNPMGPRTARAFATRQALGAKVPGRHMREVFSASLISLPAIWFVRGRGSRKGLRVGRCGRGNLFMWWQATEMRPGRVVYIFGKRGHCGTRRNKLTPRYRFGPEWVARMYCATV